MYNKELNEAVLLKIEELGYTKKEISWVDACPTEEGYVKVRFYGTVEEVLWEGELKY